MGENETSSIKSQNNSAENNSNLRLGLSNFRPGSSNSNPRPGPSNSNKSSSSNHWLERDREHKNPKKRSHSNDVWGKNNKLIIRETSDKMKKDGNSGTKLPNENFHDISFMSVQDIGHASHQRAVATMAVTMPHQSQMQIMHHEAIPYPSYGYNYNASENYHMDSNQGAYAVNPSSSMMPINSQWPISNAMPATASNVASSSGMGISNGLEMVGPAYDSMNAYPYFGNSNASLYERVPIMPSISHFTPFPVMNNMDPIVPIFNNLEPITITRAVLTPPFPGERHNHRSKPPGCRTVFVGKLPEKITEEIIKETFKICGQISVVRMNKKNFCHITFVNMESVDQALFLSGFRIRIDENEDPAYNGRLHVDYANAHEDQHDYECLERARLREERHRQRENFRPLLPTPIPHFSEREVQALAERLREEGNKFREGLQVLITWLDKGECNKKTTGTFFSLIQSSYSHVKKLRNERREHEEEAEKAQQRLNTKTRAIEREIKEIEKVFMAAKTQKVWDYFSKGQRKHIEEMKNDTDDLKRTNSEFLIDKREEESMVFSDNEDRDDGEKLGDMLQLAPTKELNILQEKINSLTKERDTAYQKIEEFKDRCAEHQDENAKLKLELKEGEKLTINDAPDSFVDRLCFNDSATQCSPSRVDDTENDSLLISSISIFLHAHPFGASIDYICSYLVKIIPTIKARDVESILRKFPHLFREVSTGIGATLEMKWTHIGFEVQN